MNLNRISIVHLIFIYSWLPSSRTERRTPLFLSVRSRVKICHGFPSLQAPKISPRLLQFCTLDEVRRMNAIRKKFCMDVVVFYTTRITGKERREVDTETLRYDSQSGKEFNASKCTSQRMHEKNLYSGPVRNTFSYRLTWNSPRY